MSLKRTTKLLLVLAALMLTLMPQASQAANNQFFPQTNRTVADPFLDYFYRYGGLDIVGLPISDAAQENGYLVQWFERQRFEFHPENAEPYRVLLSRLGAEAGKGQQFAAGQPLKVGQFFAETGHSLSGDFLHYWQARGGLPVFGLPLSETFLKSGYTVQYFERAIFEYHPEKVAQGYPVELSLLGRQFYERSQAQPASAQASPAERELLDKVNAARVAAGIQPVASNARLMAVSRDRSRDMAARNYFAHITPEGVDLLGQLDRQQVGFVDAGEIIHRNTYPAAEASDVAYKGFMNSPAHRDIIMTANFTHVGVGVADSASGQHYFTMIFIEP